MFKKLLLNGKALIVASVLVAATFATNVNVYASTAWTGIRDITSLQLVNDMKIGWNLGNALDATGGETNWGNPVTTHAMIDKIKEAGFNTVRIPVTWDGHMGEGPDYTLDQTWLNRVEEVANYAMDNDMYVIINLHHEDSWIKPFYANEVATMNQLTKVWAQVADRFKWYSDYLIFETMNEPRPVGTADEWSGGSFENRDVINKCNLAAVNTIRGAGGHNASRYIMIPTIAASATAVAINDLVIPNNDSRVIVSIHMYSPYSFALDSNGTSSWGSESDKAAIDSELDVLYNKFVSNGRAVVIGEMGAINKNNTADRVAQAEYCVRGARARGITPIWWDNGAANSFGIFDRNTLAWSCPEVAQALVRGISTVLYNFDSGLDGWTGSNVVGGPWTTNSWSYNGSNSLQSDVNLVGAAQYSMSCAVSQDISRKSQIKAVVRNATWGTEGTGMTAKIYIKTGSSYQWFSGGAVSIDSSTGGTVLNFNLTGVANLNDVREIGVQFTAGSNSSGSTSLYLDYVTVQ